MSSRRKVFVVEAYLPNGGTFMAYHLGKILAEDFGFEGVAAGNGPADHGILDYDPVFPRVSLAEMKRSISDEDILIANPSFSHLALGLRCRGRKVMYVQGFTTFALLDCHFDLYVSVSGFVRNFLRNTYGIDTAVIPPFIRRERFPTPPPWRERPPGSVAVMLKSESGLLHAVTETLGSLLAARRPGLRLDDVIAHGVPQQTLLSRIGASRHLLSLSLAEGFGLVPLEAMALGTTVLGFDGFGGRDYMRPGVNCAVTRYPDVEGLAGRILQVLDDSAYAQTLAAAGRETAQSPLYGYERFRADWRARFAALLRQDAPVKE